MTGKRVLLVGDFDRSGHGAQYFNTNFILHAGLVRAGCHVFAFSDRDAAREASILRRKAFGRDRMNRHLLDTARTYRPHIVLFGHADMTGEDTFAEIRRAVPGVYLAQFNVDALFRTRTMARFHERAAHMDVSFITTGAPARLAEISTHTGALAFFPNPVDAALSVADVSQVASRDVAHDGIFLGTNIERREAQVRDLQDRLPDDFRFFAGGGLFGAPRLSGPGFLETLATGTMSPNLPLDERVPVDFLYSSDRLAQLFGNGLLAFCSESAGLESIYEDGIVNYSSIDDLADKMAELAKDDTRRRQIASTGRRIALERTSAERVARYMLDLILLKAPSTDYGWPSELI